MNELKDLIADKKIIKEISKIRPTKEEVDKMNEWAWIQDELPIKSYKLGYAKGISVATELIEDEIKFIEDNNYGCWECSKHEKFNDRINYLKSLLESSLSAKEQKQ